MSEYTLIVPGDPVPKGRPRVYRGHGVTPQRTRTAEARIRAGFKDRYPDAIPLYGPVRVTVGFWKARRGRPDLDNLVKLVTDALNGLAYVDDEQIKQLDATQFEPDQLVMGKRPGTRRKRRAGDPYTCHGVAYEPHTRIHVAPILAWPSSTPSASISVKGEAS